LTLFHTSDLFQEHLRELRNAYMPKEEFKLDQ